MGLADNRCLIQSKGVSTSGIAQKLIRVINPRRDAALLAMSGVRVVLACGASPGRSLTYHQPAPKSAWRGYPHPSCRCPVALRSTSNWARTGTQKLAWHVGRRRSQTSSGAAGEHVVYEHGQLFLKPLAGGRILSRVACHWKPRRALYNQQGHPGGPCVNAHFLHDWSDSDDR
jgi:hypothetical protein